MAREHVTVGIVGGGIGGLTLAKMLEMIGVSYILYESYHDIAPDSGASLGVMPNGLRIIDQLGLTDKFEAFHVVHDYWEHRDGETGDLYARSTFMRHYPATMGYEGFFMARQDVLRLLYESLEDKSRVHTSKRVVSIQELDDSAVVEAADGSSFFCDFVAGADGVRSVVRDHILAATAQPPLGCKWGTLIRNVRGVSDSLEDLRAEAACVFGISKPIPQIPAGRHFTVYRPKVSGLVFAGLNGRLYWFLFKLLPEPIEYGKATSYTQADIDEVIANISDAPVTDGMVPHAAMGANQAMESAACFVNNLRKLPMNPDGTFPRISRSQADECLEAYAKRRQERMAVICKVAATFCRMQLKVGPPAQGFIGALRHFRDEDFLQKGLEQLSGAEALENWHCGSKYVDYYGVESVKALKILEEKGDLAALGLERAVVQ
ncbi:hypothetical protein PLIIFM63780_010523 [Purpureocillium lilacinum]|nr:hypothetical protein PLIIFM63780_010523 [Purpureocillium lilacinum]